MRSIVLSLSLLLTLTCAELIGLNTKAYKAGSVEPPPKAAIRLYMHRFCPWCKRVLMYMVKKNLTVDLVNVNINNKPDWFLLANSKGQVPTLRHVDKFLSDSKGICEYLDIMFPNATLLPLEDSAREKEKSLAMQLEKIVTRSTNAMFGYIKYPKNKAKQLVKIHDALRQLETELKEESFFSGQTLGHSDYMTYPFMEQLLIISHFAEGEINLSLSENEFPGSKLYPKLSHWFGRMRELPEVKAVQQPVQYQLEHYAGYFDGTGKNFDAGI